MRFTECPLVSSASFCCVRASELRTQCQVSVQRCLTYCLLVERGRRVGGDRRDGERVDETDRTHQLLHPSQLALVLRVGELDDEARRRALQYTTRQAITARRTRCAQARYTISLSLSLSLSPTTSLNVYLYQP